MRIKRKTIFDAKNWDQQIAAMWAAGRMDTRDIADVMLVHESEIYNALHRMREAKREHIIYLANSSK